MINPMARMSSSTVTKIKMTAAWRFLIGSTTVEAAVSAAIMMTSFSYRSPKTEVRESKIHGGECNCGVRNCRKTLTGKDWQRPELQNKYAGYFSAYLARKIAIIETER